MFTNKCSRCLFLLSLFVFALLSLAYADKTLEGPYDSGTDEGMNAFREAFKKDTGRDVYHLGDDNIFTTLNTGESGIGQCTWFAHALRKDKLPARSNAFAWLSACKNAGYATGDKNNPKAGSICVWGNEVGGGSGHVAFVSKVFPDGTFEIWDCNWDPPFEGKITRRLIDKFTNITGFIYWPNNQVTEPLEPLKIVGTNPSGDDLLKVPTNQKITIEFNQELAPGQHFANLIKLEPFGFHLLPFTDVAINQPESKKLVLKNKLPWTPGLEYTVVLTSLIRSKSGSILGKNSSFSFQIQPSGQSSPAPSAPAGINPKDGAEMILIPAGEFWMGGGVNAPKHKVYLDAYYIYKYEVTNEQFDKFVRETGYKAQGDWRYGYNSQTGNHPVVSVSWWDAVAYCKWAGVRLPTEAEWEKAARGTDEREYPWGNKWDGSECNWYNGPQLSGMANLQGGRGTSPVGSFPSGASPYGVMDMAGNVSEWCNDWFDSKYYQQSPGRNPEGPGSGSRRVLRGGSWREWSSSSNFRAALRDGGSLSVREISIGFRCARSAP